MSHIRIQDMDSHVLKVLFVFSPQALDGVKAQFWSALMKCGEPSAAVDHGIVEMLLLCAVNLDFHH